MANVVLSEKQQKKALRKKKSNKQTVKNILSTSDEFSWPLLKDDDLKFVKDALKNHLPRVRHKKITAQYKDIKDLSKEERKAYRRALYNNQGASNKEEVNKSQVEREYVAFGINHVNRLVSAKQLAFVLISNDVTPRFILDGVIQDCLVNNTPFLIVPDLRELLKEKCGLNSMIVAIRNNVRSDSNVFVLSCMLKEIYQRYKPPIEDIATEDDKKEIFPKRKENLQLKEVKLEDIYLIRDGKTARVFEPENNVKKESIDFIGFEQSDINQTIKRNVYKPLVVKRVKNDPNRSKKRFRKSH